jgi:hypothetical protein
MGTLHHTRTNSSNFFCRSSAVLSSCRQYRYRLDRAWDDSRPPLSFGMLNPSTADHEHNDATIERCERRARLLGFGSIVVWNLFAFRTPQPLLLKRQADPVGPQNDEYIERILVEIKERGGSVIVGWGSHGSLLDRPKAIREIANTTRVAFLCLGTTTCGQPKHPLYISYGKEPVCWPRPNLTDLSKRLAPKTT